MCLFVCACMCCAVGLLVCLMLVCVYLAVWLFVVRACIGFNVFVRASWVVHV